MTTKTPLDSSSWEMKGECFVNPGVSGFDYSNNHTHMEKFKGNWYMFYHTQSLKRGMGIVGSYRSLCVDRINVDEENVTIEKAGGTKKGVKSINRVDPFTVNYAAELNNTADIIYDTSDMNNPDVISSKEGSWFSVKDVEFTPSGETDTEEEIPVLEKTAVDTIRYNITVTSVDKNTTVSMYPATSDGDDCVGSAEITGTGKYTITCDIGGADGFMNMGYFKVDNDAPITFVIDSITVNGKYDIDISAELTNTREWADGLKNIWNGFSDQD
ncbi:MAG: beta-xylosidase, partial [Ruminococcus sp.]